MIIAMLSSHAKLSKDKTAVRRAGVAFAEGRQVSDSTHLYSWLGLGLGLGSGIRYDTTDQRYLSLVIDPADQDGHRHGDKKG